MNAAVELRPYRQVLPTTGEMIVGHTYSEDLNWHVYMASIASTEDNLASHVERARRNLAEVAKRLGYDLVPCHG